MHFSVTGGDAARRRREEGPDFFAEAAGPILEARGDVVEVQDESVAPDLDVLGKPLGDPVRRAGDCVAAALVDCRARLPRR